LLLLLAVALPLAARTKDKLPYGEGLSVNISLPESEVEQVVEEVTQDGVIRGTKEYNKDEFVSGAKAATTSNAFPPWKEAGKIFYKIREQAIDPRNFKDSGDVGTITVRYVLVPQGKNTLLRIDAVFAEDFRHTVHQSDGSVESSEYKDIREHLDQIELMKRQDVEAAEARAERLAKKQELALGNNAPAANLPPSSSRDSSQDAENPAGPTSQPAAPSAEQDLAGQAPVRQTTEERVKDLRQQVVRLVKSPGAPLKSAPFHTATPIQLLGAGTEVLILISTPYWYGVETHEGQHGWMMRDELELP
jgi:polyhydroxyalkanoate synthesis regulator phasin